MNHRFPNDPELQKYLRIRSLAGAAVLLAVTSGIASIAAVTPDAPAHVSVNCHDPAATQVFSDAAPDIAGCAPAAPRARKAASARAEGYPAPAAEARADDPPIATF